MKSAIAETAMKAGRNTLMVFLLSCGLAAQDRSAGSGFTAHEWGTFTSVAGSDGKALEWRPLDLNNLSFDDYGAQRSKELPSFVETQHWVAFKGGLFATIRMETPVIYFYSSRPVTVSVRVRFAKGLITEWYPHAAPVLSDDTSAAGKMASLYAKGAGEGNISWNDVAVDPGPAPNFPRDSDDNDNRYYAARETLATPLRVNTPKGAQHEKFLFYRGVSLSSVPVTATFTPEGKLRVRSLFKEEIPTVILFERRGERVGYRMVSGGLANEKVLDPPELTATVERLYGDLEEVLVARGLFPEEAHAMVQTWRDSWFEEGSRLFYIVPSSFVEAILPLSITPAPQQVVRVFVGRLELISPATQEAVSAAMAANDKATLAKYGRFLQPIQAVIRKQNAAAALHKNPTHTTDNTDLHGPK
ncbi:MAG TPA: hypothetical protein VF532_15170 [Candidatus Angelobacter sp.]